MHGWSLLIIQSCLRAMEHHIETTRVQLLFIRLGSIWPDVLLHAYIVVVSKNSPIGTGLTYYWEVDWEHTHTYAT